MDRFMFMKNFCSQDVVCTADQGLCFRFIDKTIPLLLQSEILSFQLDSMTVQAGLCQAWLEAMFLIFQCLQIIIYRNLITERLAESLRVPQAPSVMAQVFLCFRVLILRVSPQHLTSMWPTIITELVSTLVVIYEVMVTFSLHSSFLIFLIFQ